MLKKINDAFYNLIKKFIPLKKEARIKTKKNNDNRNKIIERSSGNMHKFIINIKCDVTFNSLKNEINEFYSKLGFSDIAYDRENAYLLKKENDIEPYVSLRLKSEEYIIEIKNTQKIQLKILSN